MHPEAAAAARVRRPGRQNTDEGVPAVEKVSTTQHTITIDGKQIAYTANAGTMVIRDDDGKPRATVFYISYTRIRRTRPPGR